MHFGEDKERPGPNFPMARHSIDMLAMVQRRRGNLTMEEQRLIENAMTELRFRFVQAMENQQKRVPETQPETSEASKTEGQAGG